MSLHSLCRLVFCAHLRLFALHVIVLPCQEQSSDLSVSRLSMTIMPINGLVEDNLGIVASFADRLFSVVIWGWRWRIVEGIGGGDWG